jgi:hypothetical protein
LKADRSERIWGFESLTLLPRKVPLNGRQLDSKPRGTARSEVRSLHFPLLSGVREIMPGPEDDPYSEYYRWPRPHGSLTAPPAPPLHDGEMLAMLQCAELAMGAYGGKSGPNLLDDADGWNTLDVNYEPPHVERLWRYFHGGRLMLHRIHPCEKALYHPHPWPSAMRVIHGSYEMAIGYHVGMPGENQHHPGQHPEPPSYAALLTLTKGSTYEMIRPGAWHYVRPLDSTSFSVMVTGPKWPRVWSPKADHKLNPLDDQTKANILEAFRAFYGR